MERVSVVLMKRVLARNPLRLDYLCRLRRWRGARVIKTQPEGPGHRGAEASATEGGPSMVQISSPSPRKITLGASQSNDVTRILPPTLRLIASVVALNKLVC